MWVHIYRTPVHLPGGSPHPPNGTTHQLSNLRAPVIWKNCPEIARVSLTETVIKVAEIVIEAANYVIELRKKCD